LVTPNWLLRLPGFAYEGDEPDGYLSRDEDLMGNLAKGDKAAAEMKERVDRFVAKTGMDVPEEEVPELRAGYESEILTTLDLASAGVTSVIWAMGYTHKDKNRSSAEPTDTSLRGAGRCRWTPLALSAWLLWIVVFL
jgi:hypothetical protein